MKPEELTKLTAYLRRTFNNPDLSVKARPKKNDSGEVFLRDEFIGIMSRDEEDGELSYNFSMAILEFDLEE